jgi:hypothetical protein
METLRVVVVAGLVLVALAALWLSALLVTRA